MRLNIFFISFFVFSLLSRATLFAKQEMPVYARVPDFTLTDQKGNPRGLHDLAGRVWIADFIFTRCQGMCPMLTGQMANLGKKLTNPAIQFVSFSVDPEYDTPAVLASYAAKYHAEERRWFFLTGPKETVQKLVTNGFLLGVSDATPEDLANGAEAVMHTSRFVLVDPKGEVRGYYDSSEPEAMNRLIQDASALVD